jgi:hypothetical protein
MGNLLAVAGGPARGRYAVDTRWPYDIDHRIRVGVTREIAIFDRNYPIFR